MKVTLDCVSSLGGGKSTGKVTGFIKIDKINWNTSKEAKFTIYEGVKDYESEGEPLVPGDPLATINMKNEGEKISIKLASFSRFTSYLPTAQYSSS